MNTGLYLSGLPVAIPECNIAITPPTIREICGQGEDDFFLNVQTFANAERTADFVKQGNSRLENLSDFQILVMMILEDDEFRGRIEDFLSLIFPNYRCRFEPGSICFYADEGSSRILGQINPYNFEAFQSVLSDLFLPKIGDYEEKDYNPVNERAAEIAEKLKKGNEIRRKIKQSEKGDADNDESIFGTFTSVLAIGLQMDINVLYSYTPFQIFDAYKRYNMKQDFDLYRKIATTPLMDASKIDEPKNWVGNIYK